MFRVFEIPEGLADAQEAMGTKPKFWIRHTELGECLFKEARSGTGEDWSERVACELAAALSLPHAHYELATCGEKRGSLSRNFLVRQETLVHGNEFLFEVVPDYPGPQGRSRNFYRISQHTVELVFAKMQQYGFGVPRDWICPASLNGAADVFVGYLIFDAWIGNTDRHHENWALVWRREPDLESELSFTLAPSFDHASSLGRELTDDERSERLATRDAGRSVERYVERARSALCNSSDDVRPLTTLEVVARAAVIRPAAAAFWLDRLAFISDDDTETVLSEVPERIASTVAKEFAVKVLELNRRRLLAGGRW